MNSLGYHEFQFRQVRQIENTWYNDCVVIYCDMDQVVVNFLLGARHSLGVEFNDPSFSNEAEKWERISKFPEFWYTLPWMPNAEALWNRIKHHSPYVLTAFPNLSPNAVAQKKLWCSHHLGLPDHRCLTVPKREDKQIFAITGNIPNLLIDDHPKNIQEWIAAGGIGIIHHTVPETLERLTEYGL